MMDFLYNFLELLFLVQAHRHYETLIVLNHHLIKVTRQKFVKLVIHFCLIYRLIECFQVFLSYFDFIFSIKLAHT